MHELLLFAQVPAKFHHHVLSVLAGVAGVQPREHTTHHLLFQPQRSPTGIVASVQQAQRASKQSASTTGGTPQQATDIFYLQLVGKVSEKAPPRKKDPAIEDDPFVIPGATDANDGEAGSGATSQNDTKNNSSNVVDLTKHPWQLEYRDIPDVPGRRPVTSRQIALTPITAGDPVAFVKQMGYDYRASYVQKGHELIYNNIQLLLFQIFPIPHADPSSSEPPQLPDLESLKPLDTSGGHVLQASVRVADTRPEILNKGIAELTALRDMLRGVVDMEVGDRLSLDSRVK